MKKISAALIASALIVPALAENAFAGDQYPGTVDTGTHSNVPDQVDKGERFEVHTKLKVPSGPAGPCKGTMVIIATNGKQKKKQSAKVPPTAHDFSLKLNKPGEWTITTRFVPRDNSPCQGSHDTESISVLP